MKLIPAICFRPFSDCLFAGVFKYPLKKDMKFKLQTVDLFYRDDRKEFLEKLGFKFQLYDNGEWGILSHRPVIEINSIEGLIKFMDYVGEKILISDGEGYLQEGEIDKYLITIVDDYLD